MEKIKT